MPQQTLWEIERLDIAECVVYAMWKWTMLHTPIELIEVLWITQILQGTDHNDKDIIMKETKPQADWRSHTNSALMQHSKSMVWGTHNNKSKMEEAYMFCDSPQKGDQT